MSDLGDLYQEMILDHSKRPRNEGRLDAPTHQADGNNPLCGDKLTVFLEVDGGTVKDVRFEGSGCAISTSSASLMTEAVKGKPIAEAEATFEKFVNLLTQKEDVDPADLGKLAVFAGVSEFPTRVKCATLSWHTLHAALGKNQDPVSTE